MKRYFFNGEEITKERAEEIEKQNQIYLNSGDFEQIAKCEFITVI